MEAGHHIFIDNTNKDAIVIYTRIETKLTHKCDDVLGLFDSRRGNLSPWGRCDRFHGDQQWQGWLHLRRRLIDSMQHWWKQWHRQLHPRCSNASLMLIKAMIEAVDNEVNNRARQYDGSHDLHLVDEFLLLTVDHLQGVRDHGQHICEFLNHGVPLSVLLLC
jgi:hypothetical protein